MASPKTMDASSMPADDRIDPHSKLEQASREKREQDTNIYSNIAANDGSLPSILAWVGRIPRKIRFWGIFSALCLLSFICALDSSIIGTALPTIVKDVGGEEQYVWIANCFLIGATVLQPLYGQLADIFGRRGPMLSAVTLFVVGSGIAGGAYNPGMLISGRTIQGVGAGGVYVLIDIVSCDLVPQRERGKYLGLMLSFAGLGAAVGLTVGGALASADWRWIFYMNIPICALAMALSIIFFPGPLGQTDEDHGASPSMQWWRRVDFIGTGIFVPSIVAILFGLITGGQEYEWSSWRVILPLVPGFAGWAGFHVHQAYFTKIPGVPPRLFARRTVAASYSLTFLSPVMPQMAIYFMLVYFQAVRGVDTVLSGVYFLDYALGLMMAAGVAGFVMSKLGRYRTLHAVAFALASIGFGILTLLDTPSNTSTVEWFFIILIASVGPGIVVSIILPAILAPLEEKDVAAATASYAFIRSFGYVWGVTVPSVMFNNVWDDKDGQIEDEAVRASLDNGAAYAFASEAHTQKNVLPEDTWHQIVQVYITSLNAFWWFGLGLSLLGIVVALLQDNLELTNELDTQYGITEDTKTSRLPDEEGTVGSDGSGNQDAGVVTDSIDIEKSASVPESSTVRPVVGEAGPES